MIKTISGIPGSGKNVLATYLAIKHYRKTNSFIRRKIRKLFHKEEFINNVYSTYPIRLKHYFKKSKKKDVYSRVVTIFDLVPNNRFLDNSLIIIDETQAFYDSEEHKDFPKQIAVFNQFHRHFGIKDIYYISQHPSRIMKKLCVLSSEFDKINTFINIPFINFAFMHIICYFERDDYGKWYHPKKEIKTYDVKNKYMFFLSRKVFNSYDSKYLRVLNEDKPLYNYGFFDSLKLNENQIHFIYRNKI